MRSIPVSRPTARPSQPSFVADSPSLGLVRPGAASKTDAESPYCSLFDLTNTRALSSADKARLHLVDLADLPSSSGDGPANVYEQLFNRIRDIIHDNGYL